MRIENKKIVVDEYTTVSSVWAIPRGFRFRETDALILAHGAGTDMNDPMLSFVHESLARRGLFTVKFNFPYKEQGKKAPDIAAKLERAFRAVWLRVRDDERLQPRRLFIGGKSMGGRIASHLAAQGGEFAGLIFLGYPLHPPNQPKKLRSAHLGDISCPMLFISGSRDPFCQLSLLEQVLKPLKAPTSVCIIKGGNHSFRIPKQSGQPQESVWQEIVAVISQWVQRV